MASPDRTPTQSGVPDRPADKPSATEIDAASAPAPATHPQQYASGQLHAVPADAKQVTFQNEAPKAISPKVISTVPPIAQSEHEKLVAYKLIGSADPIWSRASFDWRKQTDEIKALLAPDSPLSAGVREEGLSVGNLRANLGDFVEGRINSKFSLVVSDTSKTKNSDLWFIGDLHGDLLAFRALTAFARASSNERKRVPKFFFLGDLFDDGPYGHVVLREFFHLVAAEPGDHFFVAGNHDIALAWEDSEQRFTSSVSPSDFTNWLNELPLESPWRSLARGAITFFAAAPRAVLLPGGTLVTHGGVPHTDLLDGIKTSEDLQSEDCLRDFTWLRAHPRAPRKIPNRATHGCEFGFEDLNDFCTLAGRILGRSVSRIVHGHDHVPERWDLPERYKLHPLLTLNAMSWKQRDPFGPFVRRPVIALWRGDALPQVHQIEIPAEFVEELFGEQTLPSNPAV